MQINVLEYLENSVNKYPNKIAFKDSDSKYTFRQFDITAKSIATGICKEFCFINKPIIVLVDRNVESLICMMAVLYSGNFYVPLDNKMPKQRLKTILDKVNPELVICSKNDENIVSNFNIKTIFIEDYKNADINEELLKESRTKILDIDPAYVIFTSGSTGVPKGVLISHEAVIEFIDNFVDIFGITSNDIIGNQAPFDFVTVQLMTELFKWLADFVRNSKSH